MAKMVSAVKKSAPDAETVDLFPDVQQGTDEWKRMHIGVPSASLFSTIMASGVDGGESEGRRKLLYRMAGEILSGEPAETFKLDAMRRGNDMEPEALEWYARTRLVDVDRIGFATRTIRRPLGPDLVMGCSPDGLVKGTRKAVEVKTMQPSGIVAMLNRGAAGFPTEHRAQCQGTLAVLGYDLIDLVIFYRGMPVNPTFTIERDDKYISRLREEVERFEFELRALVAKIRDMGKRG